MARTSLAMIEDVLVTELEWWSTVHLTGDGDTQRLANLLLWCNNQENQLKGENFICP